MPWMMGGGGSMLLVLGVLRERWRRHFPHLLYSPLLHAPTTAVDPNTPVGDAGTTKYDPLWGEPVDTRMTAVTQPQGTAYRAAENYQYRDAIRLPCRVNRAAHQTELQRWGFDKMRELIVSIPCPILDDYGITARPGDKFDWKNTTFRVAQVSLDGYWRNSSIALYAVLNCQTLRHGS